MIVSFGKEARILLTLSDALMILSSNVICILSAILQSIFTPINYTQVEVVARQQDMVYDIGRITFFPSFCFLSNASIQKMAIGVINDQHVTTNTSKKLPLITNYCSLV